MTDAFEIGCINHSYGPSIFIGGSECEFLQFTEQANTRTLIEIRLTPERIGHGTLDDGLLGLRVKL
jgi:hypothetical protein